MDALKNRKFTVAAVMFALLFAHETRGFAAYLNQIGPSPLRFSLATLVPMSFTLPIALAEPKKATNATETAVSTPPLATVTNSATAVSTVIDAPNAQPAVPSPGSPAKPSVPQSASEMLVVSPQMLTEYFKPATDGTNSTGTVIVPITTPLPVGFTPPLVKSPSRATYSTP